MRVLHRKAYKMTFMTSSKQKFEKLKKVSFQIFVKIIWVHFHRNRTKIVEIFIWADRRTDAQTDAQTHRQGSSSGLRYSVLKWLNIKTTKQNDYNSGPPGPPVKGEATPLLVYVFIRSFKMTKYVRIGRGCRLYVSVFSSVTAPQPKRRGHFFNKWQVRCCFQLNPTC